MRGMLIGLAIAAPVGPIGILCIRRTLAYGRLSGLLSGLGAATADAIYGCIAAFGLTLISSWFVEKRFLLQFIGGIFLCYLGFRILLDRRSTLLDIQSRSSEDNPGIQPNGNKRALKSVHLADFASTLLLTLTNPMTILSFAAIFAGLGLVNAENSSQAAVWMVTGVFLGSALWWLSLSSLVDFLRIRLLKPAALIWINRFSGWLIIGFGILALGNVAFKFLDQR